MESERKEKRMQEREREREREREEDEIRRGLRDKSSTSTPRSQIIFASILLPLGWKSEQQARASTLTLCRLVSCDGTRDTKRRERK